MYAPATRLAAANNAAIVAATGSHLGFFHPTTSARTAATAVA